MRKNIIVLIILSLLLSVSCSAQKKPDDLKAPNPGQGIDKNGDKKDPEGKPILGQDSAIKTLDEAAVEEAHKFLPKYPDAKIDLSKGSYSKVEGLVQYNMVYYTDDPVEKVAEFIKGKISPEYLKETRQTSKVETWVHLDYKVESLNQTGSIFMRNASKDRTEIIYYLQIYTNKPGSTQKDQGK